jgi:hypothetical protein
MSRSIADSLVDQHAWLSDAYRAAGDIKRAKAERLEEERVLSAELAADPKAMDLRDSAIALQRALAALESQMGDNPAALSRLVRALAEARKMAAFDPANKEWAKNVDRLSADISKIHSMRNSKEKHDVSQ